MESQPLDTPREAIQSATTLPRNPHERECPHCKGHGTCRDEPGHICTTCICPIKRFLLRSQAGKLKAECDTCHGRGFVDPRLPKDVWGLLRFRFLLALLFVGLCALLIVKFKNTENFDAALSLVGTLLGSISAFFFATSQETRSLPDRD